MPDAPPEGEPAGRSDPGKIGPLPIWGWAIVGVGILGFFWWQKSHSTATSTAVGDVSSLPADSGVTSTDPMTASALLQQMQDLARRLGANSVSPAPVAPVNPNTHVSGHLPSYQPILTTSHTTGGTSTAHVSASHLPTLPVPKSIANRRFWLPGESPGVTSSALPVLQTSTPNQPNAWQRALAATGLFKLQAKNLPVSSWGTPASPGDNYHRGTLE